jgi:hypothetical protein
VLISALEQPKMAALLQTGTLVDGQWTTTNVDMNTVLERHMERKQDELQSEADKPPALGLLTQTVVESPVVHRIISARIRSSEYHDVAFIGVSLRLPFNWAGLCNSKVVPPLLLLSFPLFDSTCTEKLFIYQMRT